MRTLYGVLDLRPHADEGEIKTAFRKLAKQFHPDLRDGDKGAEQRFKEINEAHAILSDPAARARYDECLSREQSLRRLRLRNAVATMAASFALTITVLSIAIVWRQQGNGLLLFSAGPQSTDRPATVDRRAVAVLENGITSVERQRAVALARTEHATQTDVPSPESSLDTGLAGSLSPDMRQIIPTDRHRESEVHVQETDRPIVEQEPRSDRGRLSLPVAGESGEKTLQIEAPAQEDRKGKTQAGRAPTVRTNAASWASHRNARFGFTVRYPADIFVLEPAQSDEHVKGFRSRDGRATLRIFGTPNVADRTLAQYRTALIQERYAKVTFDYAPQRETWFVLSGVAGDDIFYERVTFACDRRLFHGWRLEFPSSERLLYEPIIEEMHRNYRHSNGPGARCGAGKPQVSAGTKSSGGTIDGSM